MGVGHEMQVGLSGLSASRSTISIRPKIFNQHSDGYLGAAVYFPTLATSTGNNLNFGSNEVHSVASTTTTNDDLTTTMIYDVLAPATHSGFFVVNTKEDGSGYILFTRDPYCHDASGYIINTGCHMALMDWPLYKQGRLPGETGNLDDAPSSLLDSLMPVDLSVIRAAAVGTEPIALTPGDEVIATYASLNDAAEDLAANVQGADTSQE